MKTISRKPKIKLKNGVYNFPLRLKEVTAKAVSKRADSQNRSMNAQIEYELNQNPT